MSDQPEVPETITGYLYDDYGNYTETREFDPYGGFPLNVTLTRPPETPEGKFAVYLYPHLMSTTDLRPALRVIYLNID